MQNLTRRQFGKGISITIFAAMTPGIVVLEGCTLSMQEIENLINTALNAANAVLKVAEPGAPWVADFSAAITALEQAEASWKAGGTVAIVEAALNTLAAITAVIPITAVYSPLIDILVAGIDAVLSALPVTIAVAQPSPLATKVRAQVAAGVDHLRPSRAERQSITCSASRLLARSRASGTVPWRRTRHWQRRKSNHP